MLIGVTSFALTGALVLAAPTMALGINCRGSSKCVRVGAWALVGAIDNIDVGRWYSNGEKIACTDSNICAFLQYTGGFQGQKIKDVAHYITDHG